MATKYISAKEIKQSVKISEYLGHPLKDLKCISSPLRNDRTPSFSVFEGRDGFEIAKDHSSGQIFDVISLHQSLKGVSFNQACEDLANWKGSAHTPITITVYDADVKFKQNKELDPNVGKWTDTPVNKSNYISANNLSMPAWAHKGLRPFTDKNRNLCIRSVINTVHVKGKKLKNGKTFVTWIGDGSYSKCGGNDGNVFIYEGIGDFLAMILMHHALDLSTSTHIILNSNNNIPSIIEEEVLSQYKTIYLCLDNDFAGDLGTKQLKEKYSHAVDLRDILIIDGCKDIRDSYNAGHRGRTIKP